MTTESDQIEALQQTVFDLQEKLVAKSQTTCPLLTKLQEKVKALEKRHAEDISEITQRLTH